MIKYAAIKIKTLADETTEAEDLGIFDTEEEAVAKAEAEYESLTEEGKKVYSIQVGEISEESLEDKDDWYSYSQIDILWEANWDVEVSRIYFDMDSVLADFHRGLRELCGIDPVPQDQSTNEYDKRMWDGVRTVEHFYDELELMPGAKELFYAVYAKYGDKCQILSAIPKKDKNIPNAEADKRNWVKRLLSEDVKANIVVREDKLDYCHGKDYILIDDLQGNIDVWEAKGGTGILFTSAEDTMNTLREMGIL